MKEYLNICDPKEGWAYSISIEIQSIDEMVSLIEKRPKTFKYSITRFTDEGKYIRSYMLSKAWLRK